MCLDMLLRSSLPVFGETHFLILKGKMVKKARYLVWHVCGLFGHCAQLFYFSACFLFYLVDY